MNFLNPKLKSLSAWFMAMFVALSFTACDDDDDDDTGNNNPTLQSSTFNYEFNNGQLLSDLYYDGEHSDMLHAELKIEELANGGSRVSVTLMNTMDGETYAVHAHDAADPDTTQNGTPYNEVPNGDILVQNAAGNGGEVTVSQESSMSYDELVNNYNGFFVVHDPLQPINTADPSTYVVLGSFASDQNSDLERSSYNYDFNTGQVDPNFAYSGSHNTDLTAEMRVQELGDGNSRITVMLTNTVMNETYAIHSHEKKDPSTTPNNTPYDETPDGDVLAVNATGTGDAVVVNQIAMESYANLTTSYEAFFVVHDPLQPINTADPTTYLILGSVAR